MATYRIGIGSFNLKDGAIGLGTESSGLGNLKVEGTVKTTDLDVTGVSTFQRYAGFAADDLNIVRDTSLTGEHSTLGDIVVGLNTSFTVSTGATVTVGAVESVSIGTHFSPPIGGTEDRPEVPVEGTVRFNTDLNTLEFYNGLDWRQFVVNGASGRAVLCGGHTGSYQTHCQDIDTVIVSTLGNAVNWGEMTTSNAEQAAASDGTRGLTAGGYIHPGAAVNVIEYVTIASSSKSSDFGDLTTASHQMGRGGNSSTRGMFGGTGPTFQVDYVEIQTIGNSIDFGDLVTTNAKGSAVSSPVRVIWGAGAPAQGTYMEGCITASKGSKFTWGESLRRRTDAGCSNNVRGLFAGGYGGTGNVRLRQIEMVNLASSGNTQDFGETVGNQDNYLSGCSTHVRGLWAGAYTPTRDVMSYSNIASGGIAQDFGNLTRAKAALACFTDSNGGLGGY